jgi:UDPglucose 6-dehydrogenase
MNEYINEKYRDLFQTASLNESNYLNAKPFPSISFDDFFNPDRVVIGTSNNKTRDQLLALYLPFVKSESQILSVGIKEAELIKYASNGMLAARISFMNEMATLCDRFDIDVEAVKRGVGSDSRIGPAFLNAGAGYGGSCFPKDVQALIRIAQSVGVEPVMLQGIESRNKKQKNYLFELLIARLGKIYTAARSQSGA